MAHDFVEFDSQRSSNNLYVHLKYTKVTMHEQTLLLHVKEIQDVMCKLLS